MTFALVFAHHGLNVLRPGFRSFRSQFPGPATSGFKRLRSLTPFQIIRQNGGGAFSLHTSGLVRVVVQYFKSPSCLATAGKSGSANVPRRLRSQKSDGPGYSCVVAIRVAIWKASWVAPRSASSFATA